MKSLPRNHENNGMVWVQFKRQLYSKSVYRSEMVRPEKIYAALHWLKKNCPLYKDIEISDFDIESDMFQCVIEEVEEIEEVDEVEDERCEEMIVDQECEHIETLSKESNAKKKKVSEEEEEEEEDDSMFCNVTAILPDNL